MRLPARALCALGKGAADGLSLLQRHPHGITVSFANRIMHRDKDDAAGIRQILEVAELSANWRTTLEKRLAGTETDTRERTMGPS